MNTCMTLWPERAHTYHVGCYVMTATGHEYWSGMIKLSAYGQVFTILKQCVPYAKLMVGHVHKSVQWNS